MLEAQSRKEEETSKEVERSYEKGEQDRMNDVLLLCKWSHVHFQLQRPPIPSSEGESLVQLQNGQERTSFGQ